MKIDLIWLTEKNNYPDWTLGKFTRVLPTPGAVAAFVEKNLETSDADAWLFWDSQLELPPKTLLMDLLNTGDNLWHAGLKLGTNAQPDFIDFVSPTWMLNRDPDVGIEATSWRLSLRACLVQTEVLRQIGGPLAEFTMLEAAGLELGLRCIRNGVFMRYLPDLIRNDIPEKKATLTIEDQLRFIKAGYGDRWMFWAATHAVLSGREDLSNIVRGLMTASHFSPREVKIKFQHKFRFIRREPAREAHISVIIPTLNRYYYLRTLLGQLRNQTTRPYEILVIDQTPRAERDEQIWDEFSDLPLHWFMLEKAGQCSSRNLGLQQAVGDYILFIDDDDEIPKDLIEMHMNNLKQYQCYVSNGVADEEQAGPLPKDFNFVKISNVFPTNNSMIKKEVLHRSGLFDLAYDHGQRADHDLGMRLYLSGEKMVLNPEISVLHHHAPVGGLRQYNARVVTYASSRSNIFQRNLISVSEIYLAKRYFSHCQVRQMIWINILGTFSIRGSIYKKILKFIVSTICLPCTIKIIKRRMKTANDMLEIFPQIPEYTKTERT